MSLEPLFLTVRCISTPLDIIQGSKKVSRKILRKSRINLYLYLANPISGILQFSNSYFHFNMLLLLFILHCITMRLIGFPGFICQTILQLSRKPTGKPFHIFKQRKHAKHRHNTYIINVYCPLLYWIYQILI